MAQADETAVTFDLGINLLEDDIEIDEINTSDIPDSILAQVVLDLPRTEGQFNQIDTTPKPTKGKHFETVSPEEIDEIAISNHVKKTKRQTAWSVNVFRGM